MLRSRFVRVVVAGCALASFAVGCGREGGVGVGTDAARPSFEPELYQLAWCEVSTATGENITQGSPDDPRSLEDWENPDVSWMRATARDFERLYGGAHWYVIGPKDPIPIRIAPTTEEPSRKVNPVWRMEGDLPETRDEPGVFATQAVVDRMAKEHQRDATIYLALKPGSITSNGIKRWYANPISVRPDGKVAAIDACLGVTRVLLGAPDPRAVVELLREGKLDEAERSLLEAWPVPSTSSTTGRVPVSTTPSLNDVFFKGPPELFVRLTNVRFDVELPEGWRSEPALLCASSKSGRGSCLNVNRARVDDQGRVRFSSPVLRDEDLELGLYFTRERGPDVVVVRIPVSMVAAAGAAGDTVEIRGLPEKMPTEPGDYSAGVQLAVVDTVAPR